jgi:Flp pilus assembly protein TadD
MIRLIAFLCVVLAGVAHARPPTIDELLENGGRKLEAGDIAGALDTFALVEKLAPKDPRSRYYRGVALQKKGDLDGAEKAFREALKLDPKLTEVRNELGAMLTDRKKFAAAVQELKVAVADNPKYGEAWFNLGQAYKGMNDCASVEAFQRAAQLAPTDGDGFINLSTVARGCGKLELAVSSAETAMKLKPNDPLAKVNLTNAHWQLARKLVAEHKCDEAKKHFAALPAEQQKNDKVKKLRDDCH